MHGRELGSAARGGGDPRRVGRREPRRSLAPKTNRASVGLRPASDPCGNPWGSRSGAGRTRAERGAADGGRERRGARGAAGRPGLAGAVGSGRKLRPPPAELRVGPPGPGQDLQAVPSCGSFKPPGPVFSPWKPCSPQEKLCASSQQGAATTKRGATELVVQAVGPPRSWL